MSSIWVLGAGQLGAMLHQAGLPLGLDVRPIDITASDRLDLAEDDIVTAEREQWPDTAATNQLAAHANFANQDIFAQLADRLTQKQTLDDLGIATSPWARITQASKTEDIYQQLGEEVLLKRRTGGYDGRGQHWMKQSASDDIPLDWRDHCIAERKIPFDDEVSVIGVRNAAGKMLFYPISLNLHVDGILMASLAPVARISHLQEQAESMLGALMQGMNYVGVMAMECFRVGQSLMVNEVAPRVHNSGHWTLSGSNISQFEAHLRAVADLPLGALQSKANSAMINLIGTEHRQAWLDVPGAELWWYKKEVRDGRKVGHINFANNNRGQTAQALTQLQGHLPERYQPVIEWTIENLS